MDHPGASTVTSSLLSEAFAASVRLTTPPPRMDELVDDVLLAVLQYLDVEDLLACRLVCKRLGALALHPDAWRHRRLLQWSEGCRCAVLRLAPCLDALTYYADRHTLAFVETKCAVADLFIVLRRKGTGARPAAVLRNQLALGRLKSVGACSWEGVPDGDPLLSALAAASTLEALRMTVFALPRHSRPVAEGPARPSLKYFDCKLTGDTEPFMTLFLAGHAATLEDVQVQQVDEGVSGRVAALVAGMPKLVTLVCDLLPGLHAVAGCGALRDVSIYVRPFRPAAVRDAADFLRRANKLTVVSLLFSEMGPRAFGVDLIAAVASAERAALERLCVIGYPSFPLEPVSRALPGLPLLWRLVVAFMPLTDEFLLSITPDAAPALRSLCHRRLVLNTQDCTHALLHRSALRTLFQRNPALHVLVQDPLYCGRGSTCWPCWRRCHREEAAWYEQGVDELGIAAHAPDECPHPDAHTDTRDAGPWVCHWLQFR